MRMHVLGIYKQLRLAAQEEGADEISPDDLEYQADNRWRDKRPTVAALAEAAQRTKGAISQIAKPYGGFENLRRIFEILPSQCRTYSRVGRGFQPEDTK